MTTGPERAVRVSFRKQLSDGNYGTEAAEVSLEAFVGHEDSAIAAAAVLLKRARALVHDSLLSSPSQHVRMGVEYAPVEE